MTTPISYGLSLGSDITTPAMLNRIREHYFPGAVPYLLYQHAACIGVFETDEQATARAAVTGWQRNRMLDLTGATIWRSPAGDYELQYGAVDWLGPRCLLVGEVNPYRDRGSFDLYDDPARATGARLRKRILGVRRESYFRRFARYNLCTERWDDQAARVRAAEVLALHPGDGEPIVLLGRKAAMAFGQAALDPFHAVGRFIALPHPSGRCLEWNDPKRIERARELLLAALPTLPLGESTT